MAKNKKEKFDAKNIKIKEEDLSITKIGELESAEQSSVFILILFGFLLVFIFFLPTIVNLINGANDKPDYSLNNGEQDKKDNPKDNVEKEVNYLEFSDTLSFSLEENIIINEFKLNGIEFSFKVKNNRDNRFAFKDDNYYLEFYSENNTLLERVKLSEIVVLKNSELIWNYTLFESTAFHFKKILFVKKEVADYPNIVLEKNSNGEEILTCVKNQETITYKFQNQKLFSIGDVANYSSSTMNYTSLFHEWKTNSENLNRLEGIQSIFVDAGNGFVVNTSLDLKNVKNEKVENANYYAYETLAKVVKFEMEARGFRCR